MSKKPCSGVVVPMVSPLQNGLSVDEAAVSRLVDSFVRAGVHAFVLGTTGECASLDANQRAGLVAATSAAADGRCQVHAGISGNCLNECLGYAHQWKSLGADFAVAHPPFYYRIDDAAIESWFLRLADESPLPLLLYNIPQTTGHSLSIDAVLRLASHPNIVGIKDSERDEQRYRKLVEIAKSHPQFSVLLGWAAKSADGIADGIDGIVPSSANLVPTEYRALFDAAAAGDGAKAARHQECTNLITDLYQKDRPLAEAFPLLKAMLAAFDICGSQCAPPLISCDRSSIERMTVALAPFRDIVLESHPEAVPAI
jgi:4-hydroxy-tetrahydrodipicolinate synthase